MKGFAILVLVVGVIAIAAGLMPSLLYFGLLPIGASITAVGLVLLYIALLEETLRQSGERQVATLRTGFDTLWKQLDAARTGNTAPAALGAEATASGIPVYRTLAANPVPAEVGKCPSCGRRRPQDELVCAKCGSNKPAEFD